MVGVVIVQITNYVMIVIVKYVLINRLHLTINRYTGVIKMI